MPGQHIWHIKVQRVGQADYEIAEIQLDRRRAPVLGEVIDVSVKRKGIHAKIVTFNTSASGSTSTYTIEAVEEDDGIDFDYDLEEIVNMDGIGPVSLKSALRRMPDRIGVLSMLHREAGKNPSFFNAAQIEALLERYRAELTAGNPPGHREADEDF
jgi:hypothetical protein